MTFLFVLLFFLVIDFYLFQAVLVASQHWSPLWRKLARYGFWVPTVLCAGAVLWWMLADPYKISSGMRNWIITGLFATYFSKIFGILFLFADDIQRGVRWVAGLFTGGGEPIGGKAIPRSEFLARAALIATSVPFGTMAYGIISGAHDYRVRRVTINLPNLPKSFDGLKIGQISDIHSGSFFNKTAVKGGVNMLLREKPDMIFFTGDLVNNEAVEVKDYLEIFGKISAPLGVFSVTGNHDYGDYHRWPSLQEKRANFRDLMEAHRLMGYDLLMNDHRIITQGSGRIAVIGNENWGGRGFSQYGKLREAHSGTSEADVRLLLSHDPSHWDAQVRPDFPDIDVMFAGHTHGFQFGVEIGGFRWSPSQYAYKQWAGLYRQGKQYLYVNRGFGYLGYPGRIGMPPELTIFELKRLS
ncbi:MAG TPA: metallophosphoesterase [Chryseosolibacter sp.]|nr:metallophosphoesterase [Chryseosolibacter sp.]